MTFTERKSNNLDCKCCIMISFSSTLTGKSVTDLVVSLVPYGETPLVTHPHRGSVRILLTHYSDVIMDTMSSRITSLTIVYWTFYSGADQRKHQSSASLAFVGGIHRWPMNSPRKGPVNRKNFHLMTSSSHEAPTWHMGHNTLTWACTLPSQYTSVQIK